jgi:hypothetical protein
VECVPLDDAALRRLVGRMGDSTIERCAGGALALTPATLPKALFDVSEPADAATRASWTAYFDGKTGQYFFHNECFGVTQWDAPSERCVVCGYCGARVGRKKLLKHAEKCDRTARPTPSRGGSPAQRKKRVPREKNLPPKPINQFLMFCRLNRRRIMNQEGNAGKAPSQISKMLGDMWRGLSDADREEYREKARLENEDRLKEWYAKRPGNRSLAATAGRGRGRGRGRRGRGRGRGRGRRKAKRASSSSEEEEEDDDDDEGEGDDDDDDESSEYESTDEESSD